jgi:putative hydrolase of the HAD superfamily
MAAEHPSAWRALLVDLDGVIRHWPLMHERSVEERCGLPAGAIRQAACQSELLLLATTGRLDDAGWRKAVGQALQRRYPQSDAAHAVRLWSAPPGVCDTHVLRLLAGQRDKGVRVLLATNATTRLEADLRRLRLSTSFDAIVGSASLGVAKPDSAFYRAALDVARAEPDQVLLIDDDPMQVTAARRLGLQGHVFINAASLGALFDDGDGPAPTRTASMPNSIFPGAFGNPSA